MGAEVADSDADDRGRASRDLEDVGAARRPVAAWSWGRSTTERHEYEEGVVIVVADVEGNEFCLVWRRDGSTP